MAFANTHGGMVIVGVHNDDSVIGVALSDESIQKWISDIKNKTEPSLIPSSEVVEINNKSIVLLSIPEYPVKPVSIKGRYYRRVNNSNHLLNANEISNLNLQSLQVSWD